tara:strand:+ start:62 stop:766 length:705 start_codon:yes stop_codon:yes gene_type:complete
MLKAKDFFSISHSFQFKDLFDLSDTPWNWIKQIRPVLDSYELNSIERINPSEVPENLKIEGSVYIDPSVKLPPFGSIKGPCVIGKNTELRPGIYIRGYVIIGQSCVLGNSCEFKNTIVLDHAQIPHFSYVGDTIIGNHAHLGAGVICSNLRFDQRPVKVYDLNNKSHSTGLRKLGAIIGDSVEIGCNTVLNPGSLLLPKSILYPNITFSGTLPSGHIAYTENKHKSIRYKSYNI